MVFKLYGLPMSTNTTRAMICLHEKEVDFELVPVNVFAAEHKQPPFLSKNVSTCCVFLFLSKLAPSHTNFNYLCCTCMQPFGFIPVLEDGDLTLFGMLSFFFFSWYILLFFYNFSLCMRPLLFRKNLL